MKSLRLMQLFWRKCKRIIESLIYGVFDCLVLFTAYKVQKNVSTVAVIKLDLLGDYFMWLPFGKHLLEHLQRQNMKTIFIGNISWISLARQHISDCIFIGVDRKAMLHDFRYRANLLRKLRALGVDEVLHPSYPRYAIIEDAVVRALGAQAMGFNVGAVDRPYIDLKNSNRFYGYLLPKMPKLHQSARVRTFLMAAGIKENTVPLDLPIPNLVAELQGKRFFLLSPGGSRIYRQWSKGKVSKIAQLTLKQNPIDMCVITGTEVEMGLCRDIAKTLPSERCLNLCGKTNLDELVGLIAHAQWVLCNDSSAGHIAAIYGVHSVVVLGGGDFGRCYPYPENAPVKRLPQSVWKSMPCFGCDWICCHRAFSNHSFPCVDGITVDKVWGVVEKVLEVSVSQI